jgi:hypothetical protein
MIDLAILIKLLLLFDNSPGTLWLDTKYQHYFGNWVTRLRFLLGSSCKIEPDTQGIGCDEWDLDFYSMDNNPILWLYQESNHCISLADEFIYCHMWSMFWYLSESSGTSNQKLFLTKRVINMYKESKFLNHCNQV